MTAPWALTTLLTRGAPRPAPPLWHRSGGSPENAASRQAREADIAYHPEPRAQRTTHNVRHAASMRKEKEERSPRCRPSKVSSTRSRSRRRYVLVHISWLRFRFSASLASSTLQHITYRPCPTCRRSSRQLMREVYYRWSAYGDTSYISGIWENIESEREKLTDGD